MLRPPSRELSPASVVVLTTWLAMTAAALWLVVSGAPNCPIEDEWSLTPALTGHEPITTAWLWRQHNEHRLPLPRLIQILVLRLCGLDYRVMPCLNVILMAAAALACIVVATRLRGRSAYADGCFPLLFLSWANADNFVWGWQVQIVLSTVLATGVVLCSSMRRPGWAGACVATMSLCGAQGVILALALVPWLLARRRWLACGIILVVLLAYPVGWVAPGGKLPASLGQLMATATEFLALGFGTRLPPGKLAGLSAWGWLGLAFVPVALAGLLVAERRRERALVAVVAGVLLTGMGIAWGRAGAGVGLRAAPRYATLLIPLWTAMYFACLPDRPRAQRWLGVFALAAALCAFPSGLTVARHRQGLPSHLLADAKAAMTPDQLADRATRGPLPFHPRHLVNNLTRYIAMLRDAGHPQFRHVRRP